MATFIEGNGGSYDEYPWASLCARGRLYTQANFYSLRGVRNAHTPSHTHTIFLTTSHCLYLEYSGTKMDWSYLRSKATPNLTFLIYDLKNSVLKKGISDFNRLVILNFFVRNWCLRERGA